VASTGRRVVYGGVEHITIRLIDGTMTLTPAWMMRPEAPHAQSVPARVFAWRAYATCVLTSMRF